MLKAGTCICPRCGKIFRMAYYYNAPAAIGARLSYSRQNQSYRVDPYFPGDPERTANPGFTLQLNARISRKEQGVPYSITVTRQIDGKNEKEELTMLHSCPECRHYNTVLPRHYGIYPLYVIALAGLTSAGKSAWLTAIANPNNLARLNEAGYSMHLEPAGYSGSSIKAEPTVPGSIGRTTYLVISDREGNGVAGVLLRDFSGELFAPARESSEWGSYDWQSYSSDWATFAAQGSEYAGPDLFFIVDSAVKSDKHTDQETSAYNTLRNNADLSGRPVGLILTHADKLMEEKPPHPEDPSGTVPLIDSKTFAVNAGYRMRQLVPRMALQDYIVTRYHNLAKLLSGSGLYRAFLVKSCENRDGVQYFNNPINVLDPLIWALNTLGIFPVQ